MARSLSPRSPLAWADLDSLPRLLLPLVRNTPAGGTAWGEVGCPAGLTLLALPWVCTVPHVTRAQGPICARAEQGCGWLGSQAGPTWDVWGQLV